MYHVLNVKISEMIGIDLFSGAGGMSVGAQLAGIRVLHAIEADFYAAATYQRNHSGVNMIQQDIRKVTGLALPEGRIRSCPTIRLFRIRIVLEYTIYTGRRAGKFQSGGQVVERQVITVGAVIAC